MAFITNRIFIDGGSHDGLRHYFREEFFDIYVIDLGGSWRRTDGAGGENVFENIGTGVAITFLVKRRKQKAPYIQMFGFDQPTGKDEKLSYLSTTPLSRIPFRRIVPDQRDRWGDAPPNSWDGFPSLIDDRTKSAKRTAMDRSIFRYFALGVSTNRDDWVYSLTDAEASFAENYLLESYRAGPNGREDQKKISWSDSLKARRKASPEPHPIFRRQVLVRPFVRKMLLDSESYIDRPGSMRQCFPHGAENTVISINDLNSRAAFCVLSANVPMDLHVGDTKDGYQCLPRYRYTPTGERLDNVTDWALKTFTDRYGKTAGVSRDAIFAYVYAALHDPVWRETYAINLKREFPRIPLHPEFLRWAGWGQRLLDLHIGYEAVEPWPVTRRDVEDVKARTAGVSPKVVLKSDPGAGMVTLDSETVLSGIPGRAWEYRLGNRSAIDWVLDQHKEKTPKDPTIRAKFDTYRFADHKERVVDLLTRVVRVSLETLEIVEEIRAARR